MTTFGTVENGTLGDFQEEQWTVFPVIDTSRLLLPLEHVGQLGVGTPGEFLSDRVSKVEVILI